MGLGMHELIIVLVIAGLILGASRLPKAGHSLGEAIKNFRNAAKNSSEEKNESDQNQ